MFNECSYLFNLKIFNFLKLINLPINKILIIPSFPKNRDSTIGIPSDYVTKTALALLDSWI